MLFLLWGEPPNALFIQFIFSLHTEEHRYRRFLRKEYKQTDIPFKTPTYTQTHTHMQIHVQINSRWGEISVCDSMLILGQKSV